MEKEGWCQVPQLQPQENTAGGTVVPDFLRELNEWWPAKREETGTENAEGRTLRTRSVFPWKLSPAETQLRPLRVFSLSYNPRTVWCAVRGVACCECAILPGEIAAVEQRGEAQRRSHSSSTWRRPARAWEGGSIGGRLWPLSRRRCADLIICQQCLNGTSWDSSLWKSRPVNFCCDFFPETRYVAHLQSSFSNRDGRGSNNLERFFSIIVKKGTLQGQAQSRVLRWARACGTLSIILRCRTELPVIGRIKVKRPHTHGWPWRWHERLKLEPRCMCVWRWRHDNLPERMRTTLSGCGCRCTHCEVPRKHRCCHWRSYRGVSRKHTCRHWHSRCALSPTHSFSTFLNFHFVNKFSSCCHVVTIHHYFYL